MTGWREVTLGDVIELKRGYDLPNAERRPGLVPIVSSSGVSGHHAEAKVPGPGVVTGRYGTLGQVFYVDEDFWPLNTSLYVRDFKGNNRRFVAALLEFMELGKHDGAAAVPGLNRNQLHTLPVRVPDLHGQEGIARVLRSIDDLIENNRRRVALLEEMARAIHREWFVRFRYPGHEDVPLYDAPLGPIPDRWGVVPAEALSTPHGITSGPFGSRLGRKDYLDVGVPVIRGTNLRVGGGFSEDDFVFVSPAKADALGSSIALRGDIVITQRGTLGQVGLVPHDSDHERYVLSQSQMKLTVDAEVADTVYVYRQLSSPEVTQRFIAQAMSSGVPHVNLRLLREFLLLVPPLELQTEFGRHVGALDQAVRSLSRQQSSLSALRDLLLPKLVSGAIDVSALDLEAAGATV